MIVKESKMPDISDLLPSAMSCFIPASLVGIYDEKPNSIKEAIPLLARLIDKAKYEYLEARDVTLEEEMEGKMTYESIINRGEGQYFYSATIINHLENCLITLKRIYLILKLVDENHRTDESNKVIATRNFIEHMEKEILNNSIGSFSLNISEDALSIEIKNFNLSLVDLSNEIRTLHKKILNIINSK